MVVSVFPKLCFRTFYSTQSELLFLWNFWYERGPDKDWNFCYSFPNASHHVILSFANLLTFISKLLSFLLPLLPLKSCPGASELSVYTKTIFLFPSLNIFMIHFPFPIKTTCSLHCISSSNVSFTVWFLCGGFPWQPSFLQPKSTALFQWRVRAGPVLPCHPSSRSPAGIRPPRRARRVCAALERKIQQF